MRQVEGDKRPVFASCFSAMMSIEIGYLVLAQVSSCKQSEVKMQNSTVRRQVISIQGGMRQVVAALVLSFSWLALAGCANQSQTQTSFWSGVFSETPLLEHVYSNSARFRVAVYFTQIESSGNHSEVIAQQTLPADGQYFYPASTVKLPAALVALEQLSALEQTSVSAQSPMRLHRQDGLRVSSLEHSISAALTISDNEAFNDLYEFVGHDELNNALIAKGYTSARIQHWLGQVRSAESNRRTGAVQFVAGDEILYALAPKVGRALAAIEARVGRAEIVDGQKVLGAKNFSSKNRFSLADCHTMMQAIMRPELVAAEQRFNISEHNVQRVRDALSTSPTAAGFRRADGSDYPDDYVKFLFGGAPNQKLRPGVRVWNKIGMAFGFVSDCAYIRDGVSGSEFFLSARIYVNQNEIFNDDQYEYDDIALPFFRDLGIAILKRARMGTAAH